MKNSHNQTMDIAWSFPTLRLLHTQEDGIAPHDKPAEAVPAKEAPGKADMPKPEQAAEAAAQQGLLKPAQAAESAPTDMPTATAAAVDEGHHMEPEEASPAESQVCYTLSSFASLSGLC